MDAINAGTTVSAARWLLGFVDVAPRTDSLQQIEIRGESPPNPHAAAASRNAVGGSFKRRVKRRTSDYDCAFRFSDPFIAITANAPRSS